MEPGAPCLTSHTCWYLHLDICPSTVLSITAQQPHQLTIIYCKSDLLHHPVLACSFITLCFSSDSICHREMYNWSLGTIRRQCHDFFSINFQFVTGMQSCSRCQPSWTTFHLVRLPTLKTTTTATTTTTELITIFTLFATVGCLRLYLQFLRGLLCTNK